MKDQGI